jgi:hypothetical protein
MIEIAENPESDNHTIDLTSLKEAAAFLFDARVEIRQAAAQLFAGLSVDETGSISKLLLKDPKNLISPLVSKLADSPQVAALAWDALTNFAAVDSEIAIFIAEYHINAVMNSLCSPTNILSDAAARLLCNLTKHSHPSISPERLLPVLVRLLQAGSSANPNCTFEYCASAIADLTTLPEGRKFFLDGLSSGTDLLTCVLIPDLQGFHSKDDASQEPPSKRPAQTKNGSCIRRGGAAAAIKNCLLDVNHHDEILNREEMAEANGAFFLIGALASRLLSPESKLDEEELQKLPMELRILDRNPESDRAIRAIIIESLIALGTTRRGRDCMRKKSIYPILREWHKIESEECLSELLVRLVELLIRDESSA